MTDSTEKRTEQRLKYNWPMRFAKDFDKLLLTGKMVDVSQWGGAFVCNTDKNCPDLYQEITTLFSVPRFGQDNSYDMANYTRTARICRIDHINDNLRCIAVQFTEPLFFKPGEQHSLDDSETQCRLNTASV